MGIYYHYANFTKRERFGVGAVGGSSKGWAFGYTLASRAFHLLLAGQPGTVAPSAPGTRGSWAGDSIAVVGDDNMPDWEQFQREFADLEANAILLVYRTDGFEPIGEVAESNTFLFMQLCHLVATRQAMELEPHLKQRFGGPFLRRYKELCKEHFWFKPKDVVVAARG